jgi:hypothetical protein
MFTQHLNWGRPMVLRFLGGAVVAALAMACFGLTPAAANSISSRTLLKHDCCKTKKKKKVVARCGKYCAIATALAAKSAHKGHKAGKWHGWVATRKGFAFYLDGGHYKGGTPCGPPMAYNNWEGGFHRRVFWTLTDRDRY